MERTESSWVKKTGVFEGAKERSSVLEGVGLLRALVFGVGLFAVLSVPLTLNVQASRYRSESTSMAVKIQRMQEKTTSEKAMINTFLQENFPNAKTYDIQGQTFSVRDK